MHNSLYASTAISRAVALAAYLQLSPSSYFSFLANSISKASFSKAFHVTAHSTNGSESTNIVTVFSASRCSERLSQFVMHEVKSYRYFRYSCLSAWCCVLFLLWHVPFYCMQKMFLWNDFAPFQAVQQNSSPKFFHSMKEKRKGNKRIDRHVRAKICPAEWE